MDGFITSFVTVTMAEIGDKTQLLSLLLTIRFKNKLAIIVGILVATLLNHAASAFLGVWLAQFIASILGQAILAVSFIALGLWLLVPDKEDDMTDNLKYGAFIVSTVLFFVAEIGDKTQIATVLMGAKYESIIIVTAGTTLGMLLANIPVVLGGEKLMQKLPMQWAHRIAAAIFVGFGLLQLILIS